jgi:hypothetical protein
MGDREAIRQHIEGDPHERARRDDLLDAVIDAFESGGPDRVASELRNRLDTLSREANAKLSELDGLLS